MEKEYLKELGKQLLNIGVAIVVFAIIQPLMKGDLKPSIAIYSIITYIIITTFGLFFVKLGEGENKNDSN